MKKTMIYFLALLAAFCANLFAQTPDDVVLGYSSRIHAYQGERKTFRVYFGESVSNLPTFFNWATSDRASGKYTSAVSVVSAVSGIVDCTFAPTMLATNGNFIWEAGYISVPGVKDRGAFDIFPSPSMAGTNLPPQGTIVNWGQYTGYLNTGLGPYRPGSGMSFVTNSDGSVTMTYAGAGVGDVMWSDLSPVLSSNTNYSRNYLTLTNVPSKFPACSNSDYSTIANVASGVVGVTSAQISNGVDTAHQALTNAATAQSGLAALSNLTCWAQGPFALWHSGAFSGSYATWATVAPVASNGDSILVAPGSYTITPQGNALASGVTVAGCGNQLTTLTSAQYFEMTHSTNTFMNMTFNNAAGKIYHIGDGVSLTLSGCILDGTSPAMTSSGAGSNNVTMFDCVVRPAIALSGSGKTNVLWSYNSIFSNTCNFVATNDFIPQGAATIAQIGNMATNAGGAGAGMYCQSNGGWIVFSPGSDSWQTDSNTVKQQISTNTTAIGLLQVTNQYAFTPFIVTGTNPVICFTNGPIQSWTVTNTSRFTVDSRNTNKAEWVRLAIWAGANSLTTITNGTIVGTWTNNGINLLDGPYNTNLVKVGSW